MAHIPTIPEDQAPSEGNVVALPLADRMIATDFRRIDKGALIGFFNLEITGWHLRLNGCKWFAKGGQEWIGLPSEKYVTRDGQTKYRNAVEITDRDVNQRFQLAAIAAVRKLA